MTERFKYARTPLGTRRSAHLRRFKDPIQHDKYYAYIKHRSQAQHLQQTHHLTWAQWQQLWPDTMWSRRGRSPHSLRLIRVNPQEGWCVKNCAVVQNHTHRSLMQLTRLHSQRPTPI